MRLGEIYSYTVVGQGPQAFALALVRLAGGRLLMGRVIRGETQLRIGVSKQLSDRARFAVWPGPGRRLDSGLSGSGMMDQFWDKPLIKRASPGAETPSLDSET